MDDPRDARRKAAAAADGDPVRFVLDGKAVEARGVAPTTTVLEYVREHAGRTGTKEGCAEGDCGACTVVLGELDGDGRVRWRAVNSCIRFLPTIDGKELVTVESLAEPGEALHPVQQAMVDNHASQCGFCTPGFVMSLFALYLGDPEPSRDDVVEALAGNLCRCTGYRPIIAAGCTMNDHAEPVRWSRADAASDARRDALLALRRAESLRLPGFVAPRSVDELAAAYAEAPQSLLLAGGTDVGLWVTKHLRELPPIIHLGEVAELQRIDDVEGGLRIGAAVVLTDAWKALVDEYPELAEVAQRFGSPPVRNSGTLCGNVANGSPIGDAMPALMALGARVELRCGERTRTLALEEFYLGYQRKALDPGEFVAAVLVPRRDPEIAFACYKWSKRIDQDISAVCAAFALRIDQDLVASARVAFGGMAAIPARATHAEAALTGKAFDAATVEAAAAALADDFTPIDDMRASAAYRLRAAGNLLRRFHLEWQGAPTPLRTHEVAV